jgi:transposase
MEGVRGDEPVSALCRREGISANIYYKWLKDFMEAGKSRLKGNETRDATRGEVHDLRRENERLKQLVAELSLDNMVLKKSLL